MKDKGERKGEREGEIFGYKEESEREFTYTQHILLKGGVTIHHLNDTDSKAPNICLFRGE